MLDIEKLYAGTLFFKDYETDNMERREVVFSILSAVLFEIDMFYSIREYQTDETIFRMKLIYDKITPIYNDMKALVSRSREAKLAIIVDPRFNFLKTVDRFKNRVDDNVNPRYYLRDYGMDIWHDENVPKDQNGTFFSRMSEEKRLTYGYCDRSPMYEEYTLQALQSAIETNSATPIMDLKHLGHIEEALDYLETISHQLKLMLNNLKPVSIVCPELVTEITEFMARIDTLSIPLKAFIVAEEEKYTAKMVELASKRRGAIKRQRKK